GIAGRSAGHDRARRRGRPCRHAVRLRLPDLSARHLGARTAGDAARARDPSADGTAGRFFRAPRPRAAQARLCRRHRDLRSGDSRLLAPRRAALRSAGWCQAHGDAVARRRIHDRQRRGDLGSGRNDRRRGRPGAARLSRVSMPDHQIFEAGDVTLQSGLTYRRARLAYKTYGALNVARSNAIVYPTSYGAQHYDLEWAIGEGKALDPTKYFIVIMNK